MQMFISIALQVQEKLNITDKSGCAMTIRFAQLYPPDKMVKIVERAKEYPWCSANPTAAFMKAVGEVNKIDPRKNDLPKKPKKPFIQKKLKI